MKSILFFSLILGIWLAMGACSDETTADFGYQPDEVDADSLWESGNVELKPGIQDAMVKVNFKRRNFRYYMPENLKSEGVSLIFDFHGNMPYYPGNPYNPVGGFNKYHMACTMADTANFIIVKPVGAFVPEGGIPGVLETLGWNDQETNVLFVDKMVEYFKAGCEGLDMNRIYVTGVSSGGIFSFGMAALRSELIAASVPIVGQYAMGADFVKPSRAVPIRNLIGEYDDVVSPDAAYDNMLTWAVNVANCKADDTEQWEAWIYGRWGDEHQVDVTAWKNGTADVEFWLLHGFGHAIDDSYTWPVIWEFMRTHPKK